MTGSGAVEAAARLTIAQALSHLLRAEMHSSPTSQREERTKAREILEAAADETVVDLITAVAHLEHVAEWVADQMQGAGAEQHLDMQDAARIALERYRHARAILTAADERPGQDDGLSGGEG